MSYLVETNPKLKWDYSHYFGKLATLIVHVNEAREEDKTGEIHIPRESVVMIIAMEHQAAPLKFRQNKKFTKNSSVYMNWITFQALHFYKVLWGEKIYHFKGTKLSLVPMDR